MKELYYAYKQHKSGKTARQIRAGIIRGDWKQVELRSAAHQLDGDAAPQPGARNRRRVDASIEGTYNLESSAGE